MAISSSTASVIAQDTSTASATKTCIIPSEVPEGATIFVGFYNRTNATATLVGVSDPVNGSWTLTDRVSTATHSGTSGTFFIVRENSASLVSEANRTITVETSEGVSSVMAAGWIDLDGSTSALVFQAFATAAVLTTTTDADSNTVADADAGAVVGFSSSNGSQATWTEDAGGTVIAATGGRAQLFFLSYAASGGPYGFTTTPATSGNFMFHVVAFSEPAAGGGSNQASVRNFRRMMFGMG